ncbi:MAG: N-acetylmuramoyl-L-alanine amidase [Bacteroidota bacterium]
MKNPTKLFLLATAISCLAFTKPTPTEPKQINVVIDVSHGGDDTGASSNGVTEKQIVQEIAQKIRDLNKNKNVKIYLTRNSDVFLSLNNRTNIINSIKPDLVISLHLNSSPLETKSGVEMYVCENELYSKSNEMAVKLNSKFAKNNNLKTKEIKNADFFLLKNSEAPALIVELGYLTNESDKKYLTEEVEQTKLASTILEFITELE